MVGKGRPLQKGRQIRTEICRLDVAVAEPGENGFFGLVGAQTRCPVGRRPECEQVETT